MTALSFEKLEKAYIMVYENAEELLQEARLLYENKKFARAFALSQIAHEELAKLPIIFQEATRAFYKEKHDWKSFYKRLRSHVSKNRMNFMFYKIWLDRFGDRSFNLNIDQIQDNSSFINHLKNVSLYADIKNDDFTKPSLEITESLAIKHIELVEEMFKTFSLTGFHKKGGIKKFLDTKSAHARREIFNKLGLIK